MRNSGWIYGIAVYTGHQTKVMKNSLKSRPKKSRIELATNGYIILTVLIQVTVCLFSAVYDCLWIKNFGINYSYLGLDYGTTDTGA